MLSSEEVNKEEKKEKGKDNQYKLKEAMAIAIGLNSDTFYIVTENFEICE